jgi:hypothetical protein
VCLTESWHDVDSPVLGRLRSAGFSVIDRPRPRSTVLFVNQLGGPLHAVITLDSADRSDCIVVKDVGLSDHFLLRWEISAIR